jgi:hypothetical protein
MFRFLQAIAREARRNEHMAMMGSFSMFIGTVLYSMRHK